MEWASRENGVVRKKQGACACGLTLSAATREHRPSAAEAPPLTSLLPHRHRHHADPPLPPPPAVTQVFSIPREGTRRWLAVHNVMGLHVWLVYRRLKLEELRLRETDGTASVDEDCLTADQLKLLGQEFFDRFWEDTIQRVRDTKVGR
jgi:hypothetical protein